MPASVRVLLRALVAGLLAFLAMLQASDTWDAALLRGACVGGLLAALEVLVPWLNPQVGVKGDGGK